MAEQVSAQSVMSTTDSTIKGSTASFTPFLSETARLQALKNVYLDQMLEANLGLDKDRDGIIKIARNIFAELDGRIASVEESRHCNIIITSLIMMDRQLMVYTDYMLTRSFQDEAYNFITFVNQILQRAGLAFKLSGSMSELDVLAKALQADSFYKNKYGIPVHYAMWEQARFMRNRVSKGLDNIWGIEGAEGFGKSTVALTLATTLCELAGIEFNLNRNVFFSEKKEYVYEVLRKAAKPGDVFIFDEAVNQASKKRWWVQDQVELMRQFTLMRYLGVTALFCIPTIDDLDVVLRDRRLQGVISIPERGSITVKLPNLNPEAKTYAIEKYAAKETIMSPSDLAAFLAAFDKNRVCSYPFWEIPQGLDVWKQYSELKNTSFRTRKIEKDRNYHSNRPKKEQMMLSLLASVDPNVATLNSKQVEAFGNRAGYRISFDSLARYISRNTGLTPTEILKISNPESKDVNKDAYIDLGETHVKAFLERLKNTDKEKKEDAK